MSQSEYAHALDVTMDLQQEIAAISQKAAFYLKDMKIQQKRIGEYKYKYLEAGQGKTIILLHGAGGSRLMWRSVMRRLAKRYHVLAFDVPGYTPLSNIRPSFQYLSGWLWTFIDNSDIDTFIMGGYSAGAGVACYAAAKQPERVEKLLLLSMPKWPGLNGDNEPLLFRMHKTIQGSTEERIAQYAEVAFFDPPQLSIYMNKPFIVAFKFMESRIETILEATRVGFLLLPARLKLLPDIPMIAIYGSDDRFGSNEATEYFERHGANIRTHVISNCGHFPFLEKSEELADKIHEFMVSEGLRVAS
ncbi:MAG: alpha/beta hydrolase [Ketobacteraceae bacterium]|nr:alpha/beta hydrolase [Ketobacteraceae bacterium]